MLKQCVNPNVKLNPKLGGKLLLNSDFIPHFDRLVAIGLKYGIVFFVNRGFDKDGEHLQGAIVPPAKMSNHYIGEAIDANLIIKGLFHTSKMLKDLDDTHPEFVREAKEIGFRWGGSFSRPDEVHWDKATNIHDPDKWHKLYKEYHS